MNLTMEATGVAPGSTSTADGAQDKGATARGSNHRHQRSKKRRYSPLLLLSIGLMMMGVGGALLNRVYFLHGGSRLWFSSLFQVAAFPLLLPLVFYSYISKTREPGQPIFALNWRAFATLVSLGLLNGVDCYLSSYGTSRLPASTSAILFATQLVFTAVAAFLLVRQRFHPYSINAIFLLVLGAVILGLQANNDRPAGVTSKKYYQGFAMTLGSAALYGLLLPLVELAYGMTGRRPATYALILESQIVISAVTAAFCLVAMAINGDFLAVRREAATFGLGESKYWLVFVSCAVLYQAYGIGFMGVIGCASSLMAGVVLAFLIPFGQVLAVILLHEKFTSSKGVSVALAVWGFLSYLYGDWRIEKKKTRADAGATAE